MSNPELNDYFIYIIFFGKHILIKEWSKNLKSIEKNKKNSCKISKKCFCQKKLKNIEVFI